jgi:hypothetical protein
MRKVCNCCQAEHTALPADARPDHAIEAIYFECRGEGGCSCGPVCLSTLLYVPNRDRTRALIAIPLAESA